jgi:exodeoxyribonuclease VII large subunit
LPKGVDATLRGHRQHFARAMARLTPGGITQRRRAGEDRLGAMARRLDRAAIARLDMLRGRLTQTERLMSTLSYQSILDRGFALVRDAEGALVKRAANVTSGDHLTLRFADGETSAVAVGDGMSTKPKAAAKPKAVGGGQGSLF